MTSDWHRIIASKPRLSQEASRRLRDSGFVIMPGPVLRGGATRFVHGSHLHPSEPSEVMSNPQEAHEQQVLACGPAGSIIIFNASVWHGHGANRSAAPRRSIQAHFVPRDAQASPDDHSGRMRSETLQRIDDLAKYVLNVGTV